MKNNKPFIIVLIALLVVVGVLLIFRVNYQNWESVASEDYYQYLEFPVSLLGIRYCVCDAAFKLKYGTEKTSLFPVDVYTEHVGGTIKIAYQFSADDKTINSTARTSYVENTRPMRVVNILSLIAGVGILFSRLAAALRKFRQTA